MISRNQLRSKLEPSLKQVARLGALVTVAALSLGSTGGTANTSPFIAKAASLTPVSYTAQAPTPVVEQEVQNDSGAPVVKSTQRGTVRTSRGGCGLDYIKAHESGGNYHATSSSGKYRGAYQFDQRTWQSAGGSGDPAAASPQEQDQRAATLYASRGSQPWSVCH